MIAEINNCSNCNSNNYDIIGKCYDKYAPNFIGNVFRIVICKKCGLVYINPRPDESKLETYYEKYNYTPNKGKFKYDKNNIINQNIFHNYYVQFLKRHIDSDKYYRVLDYGCGFGSFMFFLAKYGYKPEGLEPDLNVATKAEELFNFKIYNSNLKNNKLRKESYDIISGIHVIEHSSDPKADIIEARNLLKKDGYLYLVTPDLEKIILNRGWNKYFKFVHTYYFSKNTLSSIIEQCGFKISFIWNIDPVTKYCNLIFPDNFSHGMLCIIAKKEEDIKKIKSYGNNPKYIKELINMAQKRDFYRYTSRKFINSAFGFPTKYLIEKIKKGDPYEKRPNSPFCNIP